MQHVDLSVVLAIAFFSQEKRWNRPDVLHCSWPLLYFHCTVAALKIVLARGSCDIFPTQRVAFDRSSGDIVLPQWLVLARGSDDIVLDNIGVGKGGAEGAIAPPVFCLRS